MVVVARNQSETGTSRKWSRQR